MASQYDMSCRGITFKRPCKQSTDCGTSSLYRLSANDVPGLQMIMGLPERAVTCSIADITLGKSESRVAMTIIGRFSSNQRKHTVLELTGQNTLRMHVGNLLNLERTLKGSGKLVTTAQQEQGLVRGKVSITELLDMRVKTQQLP